MIVAGWGLKQDNGGTEQGRRDGDAGRAGVDVKEG